MKKFENCSKLLMWFTALLLCAFVAGCGNGGRDPILGGTATGAGAGGPGPAGPAPALGAAAPFGTFGGTAGMTNMGDLTVINGDAGTTQTTNAQISGFHDSAPSDSYNETCPTLGAAVGCGLVTGKLFTCAPSSTGPTVGAANPVSCALATQARLDAQTAYLALVAKPAGSDPGAGNLANLVLVPGVYTAAAGSFMIQGGDLTLDAQGNANAVWVFQMATTLTVGGPGVAAPQSVNLINGALAKNVFWQVGSAATINAAGGGTMVGTIISQAGADFSTAPPPLRPVLTLNGRVLSLGASVTLVDTVVNLP
jgi:hypothetical protein